MLGRVVAVSLALAGLAHADPAPPPPTPAPTPAASADPAAALVAKGEALGRAGDWSQAIVAFKHADAITPRAAHACMIALAYTRRESWARAELFFSRCHHRAKAGDAAPAWVVDAEHQLAAKIAGAHVSAVTINVTPASVAATVRVAGFEPDETMHPGTHHFAAGQYTFEVAAPGYTTQSRTIDVANDHAQALTFALTPKTIPNPARATRLPWYVAGTGAVLIGAGVAIDFAKVQPLRSDLETSRFLYMAREKQFTAWRATTIAMWGAGALALGLGAYLEIRRREQPLTVSASITANGASVWLGWQR